jgi:hypothetical protein
MVLACDGVEIWQYKGDCNECCRIERFGFRAPTEPVPAYPAFGGPALSQLLDAGQFLEVATVAAEQVPADPDALQPEEFDEAYETAFVAVMVEDLVGIAAVRGGDLVAPRRRRGCRPKCQAAVPGRAVRRGRGSRRP